MNTYKIAVKEFFCEKLRSHGYSGRFPHFRKINNKTVYLVMVQFDKWGDGSFIVEYGRVKVGEHSPWDGLVLNEKTITTPYLQERERLGRGDKWYRIPEDKTTLARAINKIDKYIKTSPLSRV